MRRALGDNDLESGGDDARQEVAAANRAVLQSNHRMKMMQARLAIVASRDVADQAQHLTLLADVDRGTATCAEERPRFDAVLARIDEKLSRLSEMRSRFVAQLAGCEQGECGLLA